MIFVGVIIITGVMLMAAHVAFSLHRRAQLVDRHKEALVQRRKAIHLQDQKLTTVLTDSIIDGKSLADMVPVFIKQRASLLTEKGADAGNWTPDDVDLVLNEELQKAVRRVNSKIALSVSVAGIILTVLTIVAAASLYSVLESTPQGSTTTAVPADSTAPFDPFAIEPFTTEGNQP